MKNKRGLMGLTLGEIVFLILNIIFFAILVMFVIGLGSRGFLYEEAYAKQIALLIDNSRPETAILFNISEGLETADNKDLNEVVRIDEEENKVIVSLSGESYSYKYFTDNDVDVKMDNGLVSIYVKENMKEENEEEEINEDENE